LLFYWAREERSDAAIHVGVKLWIAAACGLAMTGLGFCRVFLRIEFFALKVAKRMRLTSLSYTGYFAEAMQAGAGRRFFACVMRSPAPACVASGSAK
jgi:hypothetical protein